jgi:hypothetical protein
MKINQEIIKRILQEKTAFQSSSLLKPTWPGLVAPVGLAL